MSYVRLKHALSALALESIAQSTPSPAVTAMAAYARRGGGEPVPLSAVARDAGMTPEAARRALDGTGLFTAAGGGVALAASYRPRAAYFRRQVARLVEALRLAAGPAPSGVPPEVRIGVALFNAGLFFEAHEYWEDVWRGSRPPERQFYHGLVQAAAGCYHAEKGNAHGTRVLLRKAREKLGPYAPRCLGVDVVALLAALDRVRPAGAGGRRKADPLRESFSGPAARQTADSRSSG